MNPPSNQVHVNGRGNIVLQDVSGSTINLHYNDPDLDKILLQYDYREEEIKRLKQEAREKERKNRRIIWFWGIFSGILGAIVLSLMWYASIQPFDYTLTMLGPDGQPSSALTGELDKLILPPGDHLLTDTLELSRLLLTLNDPPIEARLDPKGNLHFEDLPPSYRNRPLPYRLDSRFYQVKGHPTTLTLSGDQGTLEIERNEALCCIRGFVGARDKGNSALPGAKIFLAGQEDESDTNGHFEIHIPKDQQRRQLQIRISHPDYQQDLRRTVYPELTSSQSSPTPFLLPPSP